MKIWQEFFSFFFYKQTEKRSLKIDRIVLHAHTGRIFSKSVNQSIENLKNKHQCCWWNKPKSEMKRRIFFLLLEYSFFSKRIPEKNQNNNKIEEFDENNNNNNNKLMMFSFSVDVFCKKNQLKFSPKKTTTKQPEEENKQTTTKSMNQWFDFDSVFFISVVFLFVQKKQNKTNEIPSNKTTTTLDAFHHHEHSQ